MLYYFVYKIFFTYGSYAECFGDRTLKPGMSNQQVFAQKRYCQNYFAKKKLSKKEIREREERAKIEKAQIEKLALIKCPARLENNKWNDLHYFWHDAKRINCHEYRYLDPNS